MSFKFKPGDFVHKTNRHLFQGHVISVGKTTAGDECVTVEHYPEGWIFHFRAEQLCSAEPQTMDDR